MYPWRGGSYHLPAPWAGVDWPPTGSSIARPVIMISRCRDNCANRDCRYELPFSLSALTDVRSTTISRHVAESQLQADLSRLPSSLSLL
jgi:hypothetical protein